MISNPSRSNISNDTIDWKYDGDSIGKINVKLLSTTKKNNIK